MDRDDMLTTLGALGLILVLAMGGSYATYKYGRATERRLLYGALVGQIEMAYGDGYVDGFGKGRTKGWADAMKEVDTEPMFSGRY